MCNISKESKQDMNKTKWPEEMEIDNGEGAENLPTTTPNTYAENKYEESTLYYWVLLIIISILLRFGLASQTIGVQPQYFENSCEKVAEI